jgi:hypothetical protein
MLGRLNGLAHVFDPLEASLTLPAISLVIEESVVRHLNSLTGVTLPVSSRAMEQGVFWYLNSLTRVIDTLEASVTLPAISVVTEEGVCGYLNSLTGVPDTREASLTLPAISVLDEGMFREVTGVFRAADGWLQEDSQRPSEASSYQTEHDPANRSVHRSPPNGWYPRLIRQSLLTGHAAIVDGRKLRHATVSPTRRGRRCEAIRHVRPGRRTLETEPCSRAASMAICPPAVSNTAWTPDPHLFAAVRQTTPVRASESRAS